LPVRLRANTGLIQVIAGEGVPVYADMMAHMSLWEGIKCAGAKPVTVFHNEVEHLERQILRHGPGVVVVDSIYSTTGSIAPLREIVEICEAQGCILVADESHSLGTHGPNGEGLVVELGLAERVHFRTASLAKAFAGRAGFVTCSRRFADYFKSESNPAIFSSTLLPHDIHGLAATLGVIRQEGWRRERLRANAAYLRQRARCPRLQPQRQRMPDHFAGIGYRAEHHRVARRAGVARHLRCHLLRPGDAEEPRLMRFSVHAGLDPRELERLVACAARFATRSGSPPGGRRGASSAAAMRRRSEPHREAVAA
jgi:CAI-1 autoinducer synthase